jgi:hypothetical protein
MSLRQLSEDSVTMVEAAEIIKDCRKQGFQHRVSLGLSANPFENKKRTFTSMDTKTDEELEALVNQALDPNTPAKAPIPGAASGSAGGADGNNARNSRRSK